MILTFTYSVICITFTFILYIREKGQVRKKGGNLKICLEKDVIKPKVQFHNKKGGKTIE